MQQLSPTWRDEVDPVAVVAGIARAARADRPHVLLNMIESLDGTITVDGLSGALGGPADKRVFAAVRSVADVILVGAGTVRAERYGPARLPPELRDARRARGQADVPTIAVVSARLDLDYSMSLFTDGDPVILTGRGADPARRREAAAHADVVTAGDEGVDPVAALAALRERGADVVLCEGGPSLNAQMLAAGVVDEVCVTLAPVLLGSDGPRLSGTRPLPRTGLRLHHVLQADGYLFLGYLVER